MGYAIAFTQHRDLEEKEWECLRSMVAGMAERFSSSWETEDGTPIGLDWSMDTNRLLLNGVGDGYSCETLVIHKLPVTQPDERRCKYFRVRDAGVPL